MRKNSVLQVSKLVSETWGVLLWVTRLAEVASLGPRQRCAWILEFLF